MKITVYTSAGRKYKSTITLAEANEVCDIIREQKVGMVTLGTGQPKQVHIPVKNIDSIMIDGWWSVELAGYVQNDGAKV